MCNGNLIQPAQGGNRWMLTFLASTNPPARAGTNLKPSLLTFQDKTTLTPIATFALGPSLD